MVGAGPIYDAYLRRQRRLSGVQVLAILFYNRSLAEFQTGGFENAFRNALAAHLLHQEDPRYRRLVQDVGTAWAGELLTRGDSERSGGVRTWVEGVGAFR